MSYKQLYIFIEGYYDKYFIERVLCPLLKGSYKHIYTWTIARKRIEQIEKFIYSINSMGADYFILKDINSAPCVTAKKEILQEHYSHTQLLGKLIIVTKEIESWYLGGLTDAGCRALNIRTISDTNGITKEDFDSLQPKQFDSKQDFLQEILKHYSVETAKSKNKSFQYFMNKLSL